MAPLRAARAAGALALLTIGCGEPPVQAPLLGEPLLELPLRVALGPVGGSALRLTVLWSDDPASLDPAQWVEHGPWFAPLPARDGALYLFDPPPVAGLGRVVVYDATDGRWTPESPLRAVGDVALVYTAETGYFVRDIDDLCCPDLADCAPCPDDRCAPLQAVLAVRPSATVEPPCDG